MNSIKPILYFIEGATPTNEEFEAAEKFMRNGPTLEFISIPEYDFNKELIENSGVAGKVPDVYKDSTILDKTEQPVIITNRSKLVKAE